MVLGNSEKFSVRIDKCKKEIYNLVKQKIQGAYK